MARAIERPSEVLPTPGGPTKHRIEAPPASCVELAHGEELEDAVLDLLDVVVVGVEHLARVREVEVVVGRTRSTAARRSTPARCGSTPCSAEAGGSFSSARARGRPACGRPRAAPARRAARAAPRPRPRPGRCSPSSPGSPSAAGAGDTRAGSCPSRTGPATGSGADLDDLELAREDLGEPAQALGDVVLLEQRLALLGRDPQRAGDQVATSADGSSRLATAICSSSGR